MKFRKFLITSSLALALAATPLLIGQESVFADGSVEVWSTYSTLKVMQQKHDYKKGEAKLSVSLAKGETESGQLVLTANKAVKSFELIASDLKNEHGDKFGVENIKIEVQKYIEVKQKTNRQENDAYPIGMTPDMLLPMDVCKRFGENTIAEGCNQSLTVGFTATSETPAGAYTGEFTLKADGSVTKIPVSVKVYGADVTKAYGQTVVIVTATQLAFGELNNTEEMYKAYFDKLLNDYKTCAGYMPSTYDPETLIRVLDEYWDNPNFTTYVIPTTANWYASNDLYANYIYQLAKNSTPERLYLSKATVFPIDEPQTSEVDLDRVTVRERQVREAKENAWQQLVNEGFFDEYGGVESEFGQAMKESFNFPSVITSHEVGYWGDVVHTYCPPIQYFQTSASRKAFADHAEEMHSENWYYTCLQPIYPYPSHHIDDYLIGARSMRWMQQAYDLDGYLYWCTNQYTQDGYLIDPYELAGRYWYGGGTYNGDGFLFYPGAKYELDAPLGSIRLEALRDGQEDYNLLNAYQAKLEELSTYYGLTETPDVNEIMSLCYDEIFTQTVYATEDEKLFTARESLLKKAEIANGDSKFFYLVKPAKGETGTVEFYASEGSSVTLNGQKLTGEKCGEGLKFTHTYSSASGLALNIQVEKNGKTTVFNDIAIDGSHGVDAGVFAEKVSLSDQSVGTVNGDTYEVLLKSIDYGNILENMRFQPSLTFNADFFEWDLKDVQSITFELTCTAGVECNFEVALLTAYSTTSTVDKFSIKPGETIEITLRNVYAKVRASKAPIEAIQILFTNIQEGTTVYGDRAFAIKSFSYTRRAD